MTNEELKQHFYKEDEIFMQLCELSNCNCCKYKYICESLSPKKEVEDVKIQKQKNHDRWNSLYEPQRGNEIPRA